MTGSVTMGAPSGTPTDGQKAIFRFKDNGTGRSISWNAAFVAIGITLPTTTVANKLTYVGAIYNATATKWDCVATSQEA